MAGDRGSVAVPNPLDLLLRGDWMCTLCRDIQQPEVEYDCENQRLSGEQTGKAGQQHGLKASDQRVGSVVTDPTVVSLHHLRFSLHR